MIEGVYKFEVGNFKYKRKRFISDEEKQLQKKSKLLIQKLKRQWETQEQREKRLLEMKIYRMTTVMKV
jgi:hypothetical protein